MLLQLIGLLLLFVLVVCVVPFYFFFHESVVDVVLIFQKIGEEDEEFKWRR